MASKLHSKATTLHVLVLLLLFYGAFSLNAHAQGFDFFYLVQLWAGAYCGTAKGCCYPSTGKPAANFSINGLSPAYNNGSIPSFCDPASPFDLSLISDLEEDLSTKWPSFACPSNNGHSFWKHEWVKYGTCSLSVLNQHDYFETTLRLRESVDIMGALESAGIRPDNREYSLSSIEDALKSNIGYTSGFQCNTDVSGNKQLYKIFLCTDSSGSKLIDCPVLPENKCSFTTANSKVLFPFFQESGGTYTL